MKTCCLTVEERNSTQIQHLSLLLPPLQLPPLLCYSNIQWLYSTFQIHGWDLSTSEDILSEVSQLRCLSVSHDWDVTRVTAEQVKTIFKPVQSPKTDTCYLKHHLVSVACVWLYFLCNCNFGTWLPCRHVSKHASMYTHKLRFHVLRLNCNRCICFKTM